ncbi:unnamed protein product [Phytomonas sp. Hart1]|nr:unnamed protein product [Phytomonas sp. Hart1]|eukprot:CCW69515.1 unnamed protein product [Phytomonas sp. isolate Hart1]
MNEPPLQFIDWWLSKSAAGRQSFLNDPSTSENVRANIIVLEQYCVAHNYQIYFQSTVRPRPFSRHIFVSSLSDISLKDEKDDSKPIPMTLSFLPEKALIKLPAIRLNGERYIQKEEPVGDTSRGVQGYIESAKERLADYLRYKKVLSSSPLYDVDAKINGLASLMVEVMLESITAALQREQIPAKLEENDEEEGKEKRRQATRLRQTLANRHADERAPQRPISVGKPIAEDLRSARSLFGVYTLLSNSLLSLEEEEGEKKRSLPIAKRERNAAIDYGAWGAIRIAFLENYRSKQPHTNGENADEGFSPCFTSGVDGVFCGDQSKGLLTPPESLEHEHSILKNVRIHDRDVRFAIAKIICHNCIYKFLEN